MERQQGPPRAAADFARFWDLRKDALTDEDARVRGFLEEQRWMTRLNEGVRSYQRHLSENGAAPYAMARGASAEADRDHVIENRPEAEFVLMRERLERQERSRARRS